MFKFSYTMLMLNKFCTQPVKIIKTRKIISNFSCALAALFITLNCDYLYADIEFITSSNTSQVGTSAGFARENGIQQPPDSQGFIKNSSSAFVKETPQFVGGGGIASAKITVDPTDRTNMFTFMQVAASSLPQFQQATFAEASVQYFFSNPTKIEVERGIKQGDARFFIDGVEKALISSVDRFNLNQGLHTFEIEVVPGKNDGDVTNPNFSVRLFAKDDNSQAPGGDNNPPAPNNPPVPENGIKSEIDSALTNIKIINPVVNTNNKAAHKELLNQIKASLALISTEIKNNSLSASSSGIKSLKALNKSVSAAFKSLKKAKSKDAIKSAKGALNKSINKLLKAVNKLSAS